MRPRRHVNGNSNAVTSTSTAELPPSSSWGSGRTVPANITSTSKRVTPPADVVTEHSTLSTAISEKRSGVAIARRPQSSRLPGIRDGCRPKRRVQSARGASEKHNQERDPLEFFRTQAIPEQSNHIEPRFSAKLQCKLKEFAVRLNDAYTAFDDDHNGYLSFRELCHGLKEVELNLPEHEFLRLATRVDTDGNGEICFKEFSNVFGSSEDQRCRSARTGDTEDMRVEEQHKPSKQNESPRRQAARTFSFSHLTRRTETPTRCGRTPYPNTKGIISGNQDDLTRFKTEAQVYGSASTSRSISAPAKVITTLGQEEKQRYDAAKATRLQRLRVQMDRHEDQARPLQDSYNVALERRVRTLQRHREQYHLRIEKQRPRLALSPARKGIQIVRASSTAPFV
ncbi:EF-hand domain pair [Phytophthora infestans]|uniref:EF-hand domain pair n=1 Tax=Phytophthora infestans TaxID=4787 RepID=A0A833S8U8_PHYIN|nr:EF-hand domain pair [Phytophthora infestans]